MENRVPGVSPLQEGCSYPCGYPCLCLLEAPSALLGFPQSSAAHGGGNQCWGDGPTQLMAWINSLAAFPSFPYRESSSHTLLLSESSGALRKAGDEPLVH